MKASVLKSRKFLFFVGGAGKWGKGKSKKFEHYVEKITENG